MPDTRAAVSGRTVLIAGATSAAGVTAARSLAANGARVLAVGSDAGRLEVLRDAVPEAATYTCDLSSWAAVEDLVQAVHADPAEVDPTASGLPDPGWYATQEIADLLAD